jgi:hypothetical protein
LADHRRNISTVALGTSDQDARVGEIVADRFEIERSAGRGGMGVRRGPGAGT